MVTGAWTYQAQINDSTVSAAVTVTPDAGGLTCTITFDNSASVHNSRWGRVGSSIFIGPSNQYGNFQSAGPAQGASGAWAGTVKAVHTQVVSYAVWAWAIGGNYTIAFGTQACINPLTLLSEPACVIVVVDGLAVPPGGPLCLLPGMAACAPAVDTGLAGFDCVAPGACAPKAVNALAIGILGAARARVWCDDLIVNGVRDDPAPNPPWDETKAEAFIAGGAPDNNDLVQGITTFDDYHCTLTWAPTFTGSLACFDP